MKPISKTAYYCCGVRMDDAQRQPSLCNDRFAERFMDGRGLEIYEPFRSETLANLSNATRCRIIDDFLRSELQRDDATRVITIGAGFDTRPYRLRGGAWIEVDERPIIEHKNERLPIAECPNPLRRIEIDFSRDSLATKLARVGRGHAVVLVIEGVFMYLPSDAIAGTLRQLQEGFPRHLLLCDLMTRRFFARFGHSVHEKLSAAGARFAELSDDPAALFLQHGYRETAQTGIFRRAMELGVLWQRARIPAPLAKLMLNVLVKDLNGYAVRRFVYE